MTLTISDCAATEAISCQKYIQHASCHQQEVACHSGDFNLAQWLFHASATAIMISALAQ
jgi:hypothetical protein